MAHYRKLATMVFRIVGLFFLVLATFSVVIALFFITFGIFARGGLEIGIPIIIFYTLPTTILGFTFFKYSKRLALQVSFDLDE